MKKLIIYSVIMFFIKNNASAKDLINPDLMWRYSVKISQDLKKKGITELPVIWKDQKKNSVYYMPIDKFSTISSKTTEKNDYFQINLLLKPKYSIQNETLIKKLLKSSKVKYLKPLEPRVNFGGMVNSEISQRKDQQLNVTLKVNKETYNSWQPFIKAGRKIPIQIFYTVDFWDKKTKEFEHQNLIASAYIGDKL